jgi:hypothetical protein
LYNIQFINKTNKLMTLELRIKDYPQATIKRVGEEDLIIEAGSRLDGVFFVEMDREDIQKMKTGIEMQLLADGEVIDEISTNFVGPVTRK